MEVRHENLYHPSSCVIVQAQDKSNTLNTTPERGNTNVRSGRPLSTTFVAKVSRPGSYGDGYGSRGLTLRVKRTANGRTSKTWTQRLRIGGKPTNLGLGRWPEVGLAAARAKAIANACAVAEGIDPRASGAPTVADAVEQVIAPSGPLLRLVSGTLRTHAASQESAGICDRSGPG